jgi:hypothetical protein
MLAIAFGAVSSVSFMRCPRYCLIAKLVTFLCLILALFCAVQIVVVVIGRCIDPRFGHC